MGEAVIADEHEDLRLLVWGEMKCGIGVGSQGVERLEKRAMVDEAFTFAPAATGETCAVAGDSRFFDGRTTEGRDWLVEVCAQAGADRQHPEAADCNPNIHAAPQQ